MKSLQEFFKDFVTQGTNKCIPKYNWLSTKKRILIIVKYRIINKSLWDFQPLQYSSRYGHAEVEHVSRGRDTPSFCPTYRCSLCPPLVTGQFLPHTLHVCGRNLITVLASAASPRVDISSTCKVGQKLGVSLPLLTCSPLA